MNQQNLIIKQQFNNFVSKYVKNYQELSHSDFLKIRDIFIRQLIQQKNTYFDINQKKKEIQKNLENKKIQKKIRPPLPQPLWEQNNEEQNSEFQIEFEDFQIQQDDSQNLTYQSQSDFQPVQQLQQINLYEQQLSSNQLQNQINQQQQFKQQCLQQELKKIHSFDIKIEETEDYQNQIDFQSNLQLVKNCNIQNDENFSNVSTDDESLSQQNNVTDLSKKQKNKIQELDIYLGELIQKLNEMKYIDSVDQIKQKCTKLIIKSIQNHEKLFKKKSQKTFVAAIIVLGSRQYGEHLTSRKISKFIDCKEKTLNKQIEILQEQMQCEFRDSFLPQPKEILNKFLKKFLEHTDNKNLNLQNVDFIKRIENMCENVIQVMQNSMMLQGNSPITLAATALKIGSHLLNINKSFKFYSDLSQVCQISIRNCYQICLKNSDHLMQNNYIQKESVVSPSQLPDPTQQHHYF